MLSGLARREARQIDEASRFTLHVHHARNPGAVVQRVQQARRSVLRVAHAVALGARMGRLVQHFGEGELELQAGRALLQRKPAPSCDVLPEVDNLDARVRNGDLLGRQQLEGADLSTNMSDYVGLNRIKIGLKSD